MVASYWTKMGGWTVGVSNLSRQLQENGLIVHTWKGEEDHQDCSNYHRIISVLDKVFVHLLLMQIRPEN